MAASSHNTQPWRFAIDADAILISPDFSRRCPVVDPDDHHLFTSLGCAAENLLVAAASGGYRGHLAFDPSAGGETVRVALERASPEPSALFESIPRRQCTRTTYDGRPVAAGDLARLEAAGGGEGGHVFRALFPERRGAIALGLQPERIGASRLFVLPNPSGRNANYSYAEMLEAFSALRAVMAERGGGPSGRQSSRARRN
jgi:hypothetical protein